MKVSHSCAKDSSGNPFADKQKIGADSLTLRSRGAPQAMMKNADVWGEAKKKLAPKGGEGFVRLWHFHPLQFSDYLHEVKWWNGRPLEPLPQTAFTKAEFTKAGYPELYAANKQICDELYDRGCAFRTYQCAAEMETGLNLTAEEIIEAVKKMRTEKAIVDMEVKGAPAGEKIIDDAFGRLHSAKRSRVSRDEYYDKKKAPPAMYYKERRGFADRTPQHHVLLDSSKVVVFNSDTRATVMSPIGLRTITIGD